MSQGSKLRPNDEQILEMFFEKYYVLSAYEGKFVIPEVAKALELSRTTIHYHMKRFVEMGFVKKIGSAYHPTHKTRLYFAKGRK